MENVNIDANQIFISSDPEWVFLAECSLSQYILDDFGDELVAGLGLVAFRELGITMECLRRMKRKLVTTTQEKLVSSGHGRAEIPLKIRLFCNKKAIPKGYLAKTSTPPDATQMGKQDDRVPHLDIKVTGGWGYFLVERNEASPSCSAVSPRDCVDLYLYREGE